ncbi:MAG: DUF6056 family protein [Anaerolineales bacterium]|nr:DUF6056 family protein [Anaerolineales bacterium]
MSKLLRLLPVAVASYLLAFGALVLVNDYQIASVRRFGLLALAMAPFFFLISLWLARRSGLTFPAVLQDRALRKQFGWTALLALAISAALAFSSVEWARSLAATGLVALLLLACAGLALWLGWPGRPVLLTRLALALMVAGGLVGTGLFFEMARFVRLYGDDFCYQNLVLSRGYLATVSYFYFNWSGRLISGFVAFAGLGRPAALLLQIGLAVGAIFFAAFAFTQKTGRQAERLAWSLGLALWLPFLVFALTPDPYKSIYWSLAAAGYLPLLVFLPLYLFWLWYALSQETRRVALMALSGMVLALLLTLTHEVASLPVVALTGAALLVLWFQKERNRRRWMILLVALLASLLGSAAAILAPGNFARQVAQAYPQSPGLFDLLWLNTRFALDYLVATLGGQNGLFLAGAFLAGWISPRKVIQYHFAPWFVLLLTALMVWLSFLSGTYAAQAQVPPRVQMIPTIFLVSGFFLAGLLSARLTVQPVAQAALAIFLLVGVLFFSGVVSEKAELRPPLARFAQDWDRRDALLRSTTAEAYQIPIPWDAWEQEFSCTLEYYQRSK